MFLRDGQNDGRAGYYPEAPRIKRHGDALMKQGCTLCGGDQGLHPLKGRQLAGTLLLQKPIEEG